MEIVCGQGPSTATPPTEQPSTPPVAPTLTGEAAPPSPPVSLLPLPELPSQSIPSCTGCCELLRDMQQHRDAAEQARVQLAGAERELGRQQSEHLARTAELIRAN